MHETELRDNLLTAVAVEPPLALDIDETVTRARKETSQKRALLATGVAALVIIGGIVIAPVAAKSMGGTQAAGFPGPPPPGRPSVPTGPTYTSAQLAQRSEVLGVAVRSRIAVVLPGATDIVAKPTWVPGLRGFVSLSQHTTFTLDGTRFAINLAVIAPGIEQRPDGMACEMAAGTCYFTDGSPGDNLYRAHWVDVVRADSSVVTAAWHAPASGTGGPSPEVINGYLTALANDPALHF
ncbi:hypothetical protein [Actinokineospora sp.]|uniref:hypothetical protein n=1 Tax=Actinokineospora sp. TaxID=1872133 RepID=UPI003D6B4C4B